MARRKGKSEKAILWLEALLSGKYKQRKGILGNEEGGFCCWGLGCFITETKYCSSNTWNNYLYKEIGFIYIDGELIHKLYNYNSLILVNDCTNAGFKRIAEHLIKYAKEQFTPYVANRIIRHFNNK